MGKTIEQLTDYQTPEGDLESTQEGEQVPATHVALPVALHQQLTAYFQHNKTMTWAESNPYIVGLMQGRAIALEEQ